MAALMVVGVTAVVARASSSGDSAPVAAHPFSNAGSVSGMTTSSPVSTTTPTPTVDFTSAIDKAVAAVPDGTLSLAIYDRQQNKLVASYQDEQAYYTESVVKLLIGLDTLDHGGSASQVTEMIERSDDTTATSLWDKYGGTSIVSTMAKKIGLAHTTPPTNPGIWGNTRTTAADLVQLYQYILNTAPSAERQTVVTAMSNATHIAKDQNDQWFGIPDAVGNSTTWAVKQGWACCEPSWVLNTTGLVGTNDRYILIVLTAYRSGNGNEIVIPTSHAGEITNAVKALLPDLTS